MISFTMPVDGVGRSPRTLSATALGAVFLASGVSAVIYQLVWQRSLFRLYGTNSESVAMVVTAFMLGLGLGSLGGGALSRSPRIPLPVLFGAIELAIGFFGWFSLSLFHGLASLTWAATGFHVGLLAFGALLVPTLLMGATLPILVAYLVGESRNVGRSVGMLYFVNTMGSAVGCVMAALWLMGSLGQSGSIRVAVALNALVALTVFGFWILGKRRP
jgi:MFS family permease